MPESENPQPGDAQKKRVPETKETKDFDEKTSASLKLGDDTELKKLLDPEKLKEASVLTDSAEPDVPDSQADKYAHLFDSVEVQADVKKLLQGVVAPDFESLGVNVKPLADGTFGTSVSFDFPNATQVRGELGVRTDFTKNPEKAPSLNGEKIQSITVTAPTDKNPHGTVVIETEKGTVALTPVEVSKFEFPPVLSFPDKDGNVTTILANGDKTVVHRDGTITTQFGKFDSEGRQYKRGIVDGDRKSSVTYFQDGRRSIDYHPPLEDGNASVTERLRGNDLAYDAKFLTPPAEVPEKLKECSKALEEATKSGDYKTQLEQVKKLAELELQSPEAKLILERFAESSRENMGMARYARLNQDGGPIGVLVGMGGLNSKERFDVLRAAANDLMTASASGDLTREQCTLAARGMAFAMHDGKGEPVENGKSSVAGMFADVQMKAMNGENGDYVMENAVNMIKLESKPTIQKLGLAEAFVPIYLMGLQNAFAETGSVKQFSRQLDELKKLSDGGNRAALSVVIATREGGMVSDHGVVIEAQAPATVDAATRPELVTVGRRSVTADPPPPTTSFVDSANGGGDKTVFISTDVPPGGPLPGDLDVYDPENFGSKSQSNPEFVDLFLSQIKVEKPPEKPGLVKLDEKQVQQVNEWVTALKSGDRTAERDLLNAMKDSLTGPAIMVEALRLLNADDKVSARVLRTFDEMKKEAVSTLVFFNSPLAAVQITTEQLRDRQMTNFDADNLRQAIAESDRIGEDPVARQMRTETLTQVQASGQLNDFQARLVSRELKHLSDPRLAAAETRMLAANVFSKSLDKASARTLLSEAMDKDPSIVKNVDFGIALIRADVMMDPMLLQKYGELTGNTAILQMFREDDLILPGQKTFERYSDLAKRLNQPAEPKYQSSDERWKAINSGTLSPSEKAAALAEEYLETAANTPEGVGKRQTAMDELAKEADKGNTGAAQKLDGLTLLDMINQAYTAVSLQQLMPSPRFSGEERMARYAELRKIPAIQRNSSDIHHNINSILVDHFLGARSQKERDLSMDFLRKEIQEGNLSAISPLQNLTTIDAGLKISDAQKVLGNPNSTQDQQNEARKQLRDAMRTLALQAESQKGNQADKYLDTITKHPSLGINPGDVAKARNDARMHLATLDQKVAEAAKQAVSAKNPAERQQAQQKMAEYARDQILTQGNTSYTQWFSRVNVNSAATDIVQKLGKPAEAADALLTFKLLGVNNRTARTTLESLQAGVGKNDELIKKILPDAPDSLPVEQKTAKQAEIDDQRQKLQQELADLHKAITDGNRQQITDLMKSRLVVAAVGTLMEPFVRDRQRLDGLNTSDLIKVLGDPTMLDTAIKDAEQFKREMFERADGNLGRFLAREQTGEATTRALLGALPGDGVFELKPEHAKLKDDLAQAVRLHRLTPQAEKLVATLLKDGSLSKEAVGELRNELSMTRADRLVKSLADLKETSAHLLGVVGLHFEGPLQDIESIDQARKTNEAAKKAVEVLTSTTASAEDKAAAVRELREQFKLSDEMAGDDRHKMTAKQFVRFITLLPGEDKSDGGVAAFEKVKAMLASDDMTKVLQAAEQIKSYLPDGVQDANEARALRAVRGINPTTGSEDFIRISEQLADEITASKLEDGGKVNETASQWKSWADAQRYVARLNEDLKTGDPKAVRSALDALTAQVKADKNPYSITAMTAMLVGGTNPELCDAWLSNYPAIDGKPVYMPKLDALTREQKLEVMRKVVDELRDIIPGQMTERDAAAIAIAYNAAAELGDKVLQEKFEYMLRDGMEGFNRDYVKAGLDFVSGIPGLKNAADLSLISRDLPIFRALTAKELQEVQQLKDAPAEIAKLNTDATAGDGNDDKRKVRDQAVVKAVNLAFETGGQQAVNKLLNDINAEIAKTSPGKRIEYNGGMIGGTARDQKFAISLQVTDQTKKTEQVYNLQAPMLGTQVAVNELGQTKTFSFPGDRTFTLNYDDPNNRQLVTSFKDAEGNTWTRELKDGKPVFTGLNTEGRKIRGKIEGEIVVEQGRLERRVNGAVQEFTGRTEVKQEALRVTPRGNAGEAAEKAALVEIYKPEPNSKEAERLLKMQTDMIGHMKTMLDLTSPGQKDFYDGLEREMQSGVYGPKTRECLQLLKDTVESNTKDLANTLNRAAVACKTGVTLPFDPHTRMPMTPERYEAWLKDKSAKYRLDMKIPDKGLPSEVDMDKLNRSVHWLGEAQKRFVKAQADYQDKYIDRMVGEMGLPSAYTKAERGKFSSNEVEGRRAAMQMIEMYKQVQRTVDAARFLNAQKPMSTFGIRSDTGFIDESGKFKVELPPGWKFKMKDGKIDWSQEPPFETTIMPGDLRLAAGQNKEVIDATQKYLKEYGEKVRNTYMEIQRSLNNPVGMVAYEDVEVPKTRWTGELGFNKDGSPKFKFDPRQGQGAPDPNDFNLISMNFDVEQKDGYYRVTRRSELWDLPFWAYQNARWDGVIGKKVGDLVVPGRDYKKGDLVPVKRGDSFELCRVENLTDDTDPLLAAVCPAAFIGSKLQSYKGERQVMYWGEKGINVAMDILMTLEGLNGLRFVQVASSGALKATSMAARITEGGVAKLAPALTRLERLHMAGTSGLKLLMGLPMAAVTTSAGSHDGSNKITEALGTARTWYFLGEAGGGLLFGQKFGRLLNPSNERFLPFVGTSRWCHPDSTYAKSIHNGFKVSEWGVIGTMGLHMVGLARQLPPDAPRGLDLTAAGKQDPLIGRFEIERDWLKASDAALTDDKTGIPKEKEENLRKMLASVEGVDRRNKAALLEGGFKDPDQKPPGEDRWGDIVKKTEATLAAKRSDLEAAQKKPDPKKPDQIPNLKKEIEALDKDLEVARPKHEYLTALKADIESPDLEKRAKELGNQIETATKNYLNASKAETVGDADARRGRLEENLKKLKGETPLNAKEIARLEAEIKPLADAKRQLDQLTKRKSHLEELMSVRNGLIDYLQPPQSAVQDMIKKGTYDAEKAKGFPAWKSTLDPERVVAAELALLRLGDRDGNGVLRETLATRSFEVTVTKDGKPVKETIRQSVSTASVVQALEGELTKPTSQLKHFTKQDIDALRDIKTDDTVLGQVISPRDTIKAITEKTQRLLDPTTNLTAQQRKDDIAAYKRELMKHIPESAIKSAKATEEKLAEIMNSANGQEIKDEQVVKALKEFRDSLKGNPEVQAAAIYSLLMLSRGDNGAVSDVLGTDGSRTMKREDLGLYLNMFLAAAIKDTTRVPAGVDLVLANLLSKIDPDAMPQGRLIELANDVCRRNPSEQIKDWAQMLKMGGDLSSQGMEKSRQTLRPYDLSDPNKLTFARQTLSSFAPGLTAHLNPEKAKEVQGIIDKAAILLDSKADQRELERFKNDLAKHFRGNPLPDTEETKALRAAAGLALLYLSRDKYGNLPDNFAGNVSGETVVNALKADFVNTKTPESAARMIALGDMLSRAGIISGATFAAKLQDVLLDPKVSQEDKMRALVDTNGPRLSAVIEAMKVHEAIKAQYGKPGDDATGGSNFGVNSVDLLKTLEKVSRENPGTPLAALAADLKFAHLQTDSEERQKLLIEASKRGVEVLEKRMDGKALEADFILRMKQNTDVLISDPSKDPGSDQKIRAFYAASALADYAPPAGAARDPKAVEKLNLEIDGLREAIADYPNARDKARGDDRRLAELETAHKKNVERFEKLQRDAIMQDPAALQGYINEVFAKVATGNVRTVPGTNDQITTTVLYKEQIELRTKVFDALEAHSKAVAAGLPADKVEELRKKAADAQKEYQSKEQIAEDLVVLSLERLMPDRIKQLGAIDGAETWFKVMEQVKTFADSPVKPPAPFLKDGAQPADIAEFNRKVQAYKEHPNSLYGRERMREENQAKVIAMLPALLNPADTDSARLKNLKSNQLPEYLDKLKELVQTKGMTDYPFVGEAAVKAIGALKYDDSKRAEIAEFMRAIVVDREKYPPLVRRAALEELSKLNPDGLERTYLNLLGVETDSEINKRVRELILPFRRPEPSSKDYIDDFARTKRELMFAAVRGNYLTTSYDFLNFNFPVLNSDWARWEANRKFNQDTGLNQNNPWALKRIFIDDAKNTAKNDVRAMRIDAIRKLKDAACGGSDFAENDQSEAAKNARKDADEARKALAYIVISNGMPATGSADKDLLVEAATQKIKEACEQNPKARAKDFAQILEMCLMHQPMLKSEHRARLLDAMKALKPGEIEGGITKEQAAVAIASGLQLDLVRTRPSRDQASTGSDYQTKAIDMLAELGVKKVLPVLEAIANAENREHSNEEVVQAARRAVSKLRDDTSGTQAEVQAILNKQQFQVKDLVSDLEKKSGKGGNAEELVRAIYMAGEIEPIKDVNDPRVNIMRHILASDSEPEQAKIACAKVLAKSEVPELRKQAIEVLTLEASLGTRQGYRSDAKSALEAVKKAGKDGEAVDAAAKFVDSPITTLTDPRIVLFERGLLSPDPEIKLDCAKRLIVNDNVQLREKAIDALALAAKHSFRDSDKKAAETFLESVKAAEKANPDNPAGFHRGDSKLIDSALRRAEKMTSQDYVQKLDGPVTFTILDNQRYYDGVKRNMLDTSYADMKQFEGDYFRRNGDYNLLDGNALNDQFEANFKRVRMQTLNVVKGTSTILADWAISVAWYTNPITPWFDRPEHLHYNPDEEIDAANKQTWKDRDTQFANLVALAEKVDGEGKSDSKEARMALAYIVSSNGVPFRPDEREYFAWKAAEALKKICQDGNLGRGELKDMIATCLVNQPGLSSAARAELFHGLRAMYEKGNIGGEDYAAIATAALETELKAMPVPGKPGFDDKVYNTSVALQTWLLDAIEKTGYRKATPILEAMAQYHPAKNCQDWANKLAMRFADRLGSYKVEAFAGEPKFPVTKDGETDQLKWRADRLAQVMSVNDKYKLIEAVGSSGFEKPITDPTDPRRPLLRRCLEHQEPLVRMAAAKLLLTSEDKSDPDREKAYQTMKNLATHGTTLWFRQDAKDILEGMKGGNADLRARAAADVGRETGEEERLVRSIASIEAMHGAKADQLYGPLCQYAQILRTQNTPESLAKARELQQRAAAIGDGMHDRYVKSQQELADKTGDQRPVLKALHEHAKYLRDRDWAGDAQKADQIDKVMYGKIDELWTKQIDTLKKSFHTPPTAEEQNALSMAQRQYADSMKGSKDPKHQELCKALLGDSTANQTLAWDTTIGGIKTDIVAGKKTHDDLSAVYLEQSRWFKGKGDAKGEADAVKKAQEATEEGWKARIKSYTDREDKLTSGDVWKLAEQQNGFADALTKRGWPGDKERAEALFKQSKENQEKSYDKFLDEAGTNAGGKVTGPQLAAMGSYSDFLRGRNNPGDRERAQKFDDQIVASGELKLTEFKKLAGAPMDKATMDEFRVLADVLEARGKQLSRLVHGNIATWGEVPSSQTNLPSWADKRAIPGDPVRASKAYDAGHQIKDALFSMDRQKLEAKFGPDSLEVLKHLKDHADYLSKGDNDDRERARRLADLAYNRELSYWDRHAKLAGERGDLAVRVEALGKKVSVIEARESYSSFPSEELSRARTEYRAEAKKYGLQEIERIEKEKGKNAPELIKPLSELGSFLRYGKGMRDVPEEDKRLGEELSNRSYEILKDFKGKPEDIPAVGPVIASLRDDFKTVQRSGIDPEAGRKPGESGRLNRDELAIITAALALLAIKGLTSANARETIDNSKLPAKVGELYKTRLDAKEMTPDCAAKLAQMDADLRATIFDPIVQEGKFSAARLEELVDMHLRNQTREPDKRLSQDTMKLLSTIESSQARASVESLATHWSVDAKTLSKLVTANGGANMTPATAQVLSSACANGICDGATLGQVIDLPADKRSVIEKMLVDQVQSVDPKSQIDAAAFKKLVESAGNLSVDELKSLEGALKSAAEGKPALLDGNRITRIFDMPPEAVKDVCAYLKPGGQSQTAVDAFMNLEPEHMNAVMKKGMQPADLNRVLEYFQTESVPKVVESFGTVIDKPLWDKIVEYTEKQMKAAEPGVLIAPTVAELASVQGMDKATLATITEKVMAGTANEETVSRAAAAARANQLDSKQILEVIALPEKSQQFFSDVLAQETGGPTYSRQNLKKADFTRLLGDKALMEDFVKFKEAKLLSDYTAARLLKGTETDRALIDFLRAQVNPGLDKSRQVSANTFGYLVTMAEQQGLTANAIDAYAEALSKGLMTTEQLQKLQSMPQETRLVYDGMLQRGQMDAKKLAEFIDSKADIETLKKYAAEQPATRDPDAGKPKIADPKPKDAVAARVESLITTAAVPGDTNGDTTAKPEPIKPASFDAAQESNLGKMATDKSKYGPEMVAEIRALSQDALERSGLAEQLKGNKLPRPREVEGALKYGRILDSISTLPADLQAKIVEKMGKPADSTKNNTKLEILDNLCRVLKDQPADVFAKRMDSSIKMLDKLTDADRAGKPPIDPVEVLFKPDEQQIIKDRLEAQSKLKAVQLQEGQRNELTQKNFDTAKAETKGGQPTKGKVIHIVMGPSGAGKSSNLVNPLSAHHNAMIVDGDRVISTIPGYTAPDLKGVPEVGLGFNACVGESGTITRNVLRKALAEGYNIVHPTLGQSPEYMARVIAEAKAAGYEVQIHMADVPPDVAARRGYDRSFEAPKDGVRQIVDPNFVLGTNKWDAQVVYEKLRAEMGWAIDGYSRLNLNVERGTPPIVIERGGKADVIDGYTVLPKRTDGGPDDKPPAPPADVKAEFDKARASEQTRPDTIDFNGEKWQKDKTGEFYKRFDRDGHEVEKIRAYKTKDNELYVKDASGETLTRPDGSRVSVDNTGTVRNYTADGTIKSAVNPKGEKITYEHWTEGPLKGQLKEMSGPGDFKVTVIDKDHYEVQRNGETFKREGAVSVDRQGALSQRLKGAEYTMQLQVDGTDRMISHVKVGDKEVDRVTTEHADLKVQKERLSKLADFHFPDKERRERWDKMVEAFEKGSVSPSDRARVYEQLARMMEATGQTALPQHDRVRMAQQLLSQLTDIKTIYQGNNESCTLGSMEKILAKRNPVELATMAADLSTSGKYVAANGRVFDAGKVPGALHPDSEAARNRFVPPNEVAAGTDLHTVQKRSHVSQILQVALANMQLMSDSPALDALKQEAWVKQQLADLKLDPKDISLRYAKMDTTDGTTGERILICDKDGVPKAELAFETGKKLSAPIIFNGDLPAMYQQVTGKYVDKLGIANANLFPNDGEGIHVASAESVRATVRVDSPQSLAKALASSTMPIEISVWTGKLPGETGKPGWHAMVISGYDSTTGMVELQDPRGGTRQISVAEMYEATNAPPDKRNGFYVAGGAEGLIGQPSEWKRPANLDGLATAENPLSDKALKSISELPQEVQDKLAKEKLSKTAAEAINRGFIEPSAMADYLDMSKEQRKLTEQLIERAMADATGQVDPKAMSGFAKFKAEEMKAISERNLTLAELNSVLKASAPGQSLVLADALKNGTVTVESLAEIAHLPAEVKALVTDLITHDIINAKNNKALQDILAAHRKGELTADKVDTIKKAALSDAIHPDAFKNLWENEPTKKVADEILDKQIKDLKESPSEAMKPERLAQVLRNLGDASTLMQAGMITPEMMKQLALSVNPADRAVLDMLVQNAKLPRGRRVSAETAGRIFEMARNGALTNADLETLSKEYHGKDSKMTEPRLRARLAEIQDKSTKVRLEAEVIDRASKATDPSRGLKKATSDGKFIDHIFPKGLEVVGANGEKVTVKGVRKPAGPEGEVSYLVEKGGVVVADAELTKTVADRLASNVVMTEGLKDPSKAVDVLTRYAQSSQDVHATVGFDVSGKLVDYRVVATNAAKGLGPTATVDGAMLRLQSEAGIPMVVKFKPEEGKKSDVRSWGEGELTEEKMAKLLEDLKLPENMDKVTKEMLENAMKEYLKGNPEAKDFESCKKLLAKEIREGRGGAACAELREVFKSYGVEYENGKPKFENGHLVLRPKPGESTETAHSRTGGTFEKCKGKLVPIMMIVLAVAHQSQDRPSSPVPVVR